MSESLGESEQSIEGTLPREHALFQFGQYLHLPAFKPTLNLLANSIWYSDGWMLDVAKLYEEVDWWAFLDKYCRESFLKRLNGFGDRLC